MKLRVSKIIQLLKKKIQLQVDTYGKMCTVGV